jgi:GNAT superfamily N-acetyltransferase
MITIVKADVSQAATIAKFQQAMALETENLILEDNTINNGVKNVFHNPQHGFYIVALNGTEVIASCMITYEWSDWRNQQVWWLQSVYVVPEWRKKGIFSLIFTEIKTLGAQAGISLFRLYVEQHNTAGIGTYLAKGFVSTHYQLLECQV